MKRDGKEIPERGRQRKQRHRDGKWLWLVRRLAGKQSAIVWNVTGDESDEVLGEGSRSPLSQTKGLDSLQDGEP